MTSVPRTVPSTPLSVIASSRQIMRNEAAMKRPRKHHGAQAPVLSIHFRHEFNGPSLSRTRGHAKALLAARPAFLAETQPRAVTRRKEPGHRDACALRAL